ncbi:DNA gyrase subunit A [Succinispira mobilis]|uniref:DNA gyrase subunit A n=1 Tax=Succinispira mobilis TaxID=78120 RepID=UPI00036649A7
MDFGLGRVRPIEIDKEMKNSYIDYAMSVIVMRALPDVRDGFKPVHRRILYAMHEAGMAANKPYKKSARIVGEVLGKYHPHGDQSVYSSIVRMAQDFSTRYLLVDGHGNFGSVDGDSAAAMRYTEVRMSKISEYMLADIEKDVVKFTPNYDESLQEPEVLPARIPNLLVNGSSGIAVGMATNIPPHNLSEVVDGIVALIDNPEAELPELMQHIKGPDFPTGAMILGNEGIHEAYATGRGVVKIRAKAQIERMSNGKERILVTEIPYQVNKSRLIEGIAHLVNEKIIEGITDLRDESDRQGMRIIIELKRDANANVILNQLYKHTKMQDSFGIIMLALVDGKPEVLNLKQVLVHYINHQRDILVKRSTYELNKAKDRAHILEGLRIALKNIDNVIKIIRSSSDTDAAKTGLSEALSISDKQIQAILEMRLQRLVGLEQEKIDNEYKQILETINYLESLLHSDEKIMQVVKEDLLEVKKKFGDARKTIITIDNSQIPVEDLIAVEDIVITITHNGYIKRLPTDTYKNQKRGGRGVTGMGTKEEDFVEHLFITTTHHNILVFTNRGRMYQIKGYEIPEASRTAKGTAIVNLLQFEPQEKINTVISVEGFTADKMLFMATNMGTVKKCRLTDFGNTRKGGLNAISLLENEELISVKLTDGNSNIIMATKLGLSIHFSEQDVRVMGRTARGVRGLALKKNDSVVAMDVVRDDSYILTITEEGLGKRTLISEYRAQTRGGKGIINIKINERTGVVAGVRIVREDDELIVISSEGIVIRTDVNAISIVGRSAQGVKVMRLDDGDKVVALATVNKKIIEE